jgi:beta-lactamase regulating signal transducer with metallopeptidase domain
MPSSPPVLPASGSLAVDLTAWLLTYALHSTILFGAVWVITSFVSSNTLKDVLWKSALVGGLLTATLQVGLDLRPFAGVVRLPATMEERVALHSDDSRPVSSAPAGVPTSPAHGPGAGSLAALPDAHVATAARPAGDGNPLSPEGAGIRGAIPTLVSRHWLTLLMTAWLLGACFGLLRLAWTRFRFFRGLGERQPVPSGPLTAMLHRLRRRAGIRRTIHLTTAAGLSSPVALGRREICLPERALTELEPGHQEGMLAHELAHLLRHDPAWLLVSGLIEAFFFFQPLNRVGRRRLQETTEYLCDEWAVRQTGRHLTLARCLAQVASWLESGRQPALIASMARLGSPLIRRIQKLVDGRHRKGSELPARWRAALGVTPLLVVGLLAPGVGAWSDAATLQEAPAPPEAGETATAETLPAPPAAPSVAARPASRAVATARARTVSWARVAPAARSRAVVEATVEAPVDGSGETVRIRRHDDNVRAEWGDGGKRLWLRFDGEITISEDGTVVESISPGGSLSLEERRDGGRRILTVTPGRGGDLEYDYAVDGEARPFDPEGRRWLTETLSRWQALRENRDRARAVRDAERARMAEYRAEMTERQREIAQLQREDRERLREEAREHRDAMRLAEAERREIERELMHDERRAQAEALRAYRRAKVMLERAQDETADPDQDPERREEAMQEARQALEDARVALEQAWEGSARREDEMAARRRELEQFRREDLERHSAEMQAIREENMQRQRELRELNRAEAEEMRRRMREEREKLRRELEESGEDGPYVYLPSLADAPPVAVMPAPSAIVALPELAPMPALPAMPDMMAPLPDPAPKPVLPPMPPMPPLPEMPDMTSLPEVAPAPEPAPLPEAPPLPPAPEAEEDEDEEIREIISI